MNDYIYFKLRLDVVGAMHSLVHYKEGYVYKVPKDYTRFTLVPALIEITPVEAIASRLPIIDLLTEEARLESKTSAANV